VTAVEETPVGGPPPWIDETIQQKVLWRDGDIVVTVPPKSGTTWTMNIVHQLRSGGDDAFADIYREVPWIEFVPGPGRQPDEIVATINAMPADLRRAFKSHAGPPTLPFQAPGEGPDVRYLVVGRNPDEAVASFRPFLAAHSDAWFDLWQVNPNDLLGPDFDSYIAGFAAHALVPMIFGFLAGWWPLRNQPNVLFVHYADLKQDPSGVISRIAEFLGFEVAAEKWPTILEYTSFAWMKEHEEKFELRTVGEVPPLDSGAMLRKGQVGGSAEDGITPEISATLAGIGRNLIDDEAALDWLYHGGPVPS
jgi:aryl sulfotransferase